MEEDPRDNPFVRLLLAALLAKGPRTATELQEEMGLSVEWAKQVRAVALKAGLTQEDEETEGRRRFKQVYLTPRGREAAMRRAEYDAALKRAADDARRK